MQKVLNIVHDKAVNGLSIWWFPDFDSEYKLAEDYKIK